MTHLEATLAEQCIVSKVVVHVGDACFKGEVEGLAVQVQHMDGEKCERCWKYTDDIGSHKDHPTLCARCASIIEE